MSKAFRVFTANLASFVFLTLPVYPQQGQDQNPAPAPTDQKLTKEQKQKLKKTLKELDTPYKTWLNEDVVYIISPAERTAFLRLETNEEREQFIESF